MSNKQIKFFWDKLRDDSTSWKYDDEVRMKPPQSIKLHNTTALYKTLMTPTNLINTTAHIPMMHL